jgi:hypothetical protein
MFPSIREMIGCLMSYLHTVKCYLINTPKNGTFHHLTRNEPFAILVSGGWWHGDQAAQWPFLLKNENTLSCDIGAVVIPY